MASPSVSPRPNRARKASGVPQHKLARWLLPVIAAALVVVFVVSYYPVARVQYRETRQKAQLEAQLKALQDRNARLRTEVASLETTAGVEDYARSELGMVNKGEKAVVVIDSREGTSTSTASSSARVDTEPLSTGPVSPWTAFLDLVFDIK